ncbi:unnamed protein product [Miscanthus lutarioriparius]|uniref:Uncharacterized protein n=1 Tax=Miscanthus lutarioriparius TaxID=422564 RepID=A0A811REZ1_9POAL|nr:unnamed protein product [Miscanthus lutarioriparius]
MVLRTRILVLLLLLAGCRGFWGASCFLELEGILEKPEDIVGYLNTKGVSVIFLFRRNTLRRLISVLANDYDKDAKQLNGTHKSHVHSIEEVCEKL